MRIERRFRGPPDSGNGGYFAGLLARELGGSNVIVTLKRPAPLDVDLDVEQIGDEWALTRGGEPLAVAHAGPVAVDVPDPPSLEEASAAEARYSGLRHHIYPCCFVCGPERDSGDGWRIFPGKIGQGRVAAAWTPDPEFAAADRTLNPEFVWAALDCPGYFAVEDAAGLALLGRMAVVIHQTVPTGQPLVVQAWAQGSDGRKHQAGTALHAADGTLLATATQTWVTLR